MRNFSWPITALAVIALAATATRRLSAAVFADRIISASQGVNNYRVFTTPTAALGAPDGVTGENPAASNYWGKPGVLSPFNPAYQGDEIYEFGPGGHITLSFPNYVLPAGARQIGVISNAGILDVGGGVAGSPANLLGGTKYAVVEVSADGNTWVALNSGSPIGFDIPANYYLNAGPYDTAAPASPQVADFGKPFTGTLADFGGKSYAQMLTLLNGSGGGTWLDITGTGLSQIDYIRFSLPVNATGVFVLDSVAIANNAVGSATPEPASLLVLIGGGAMLLLGRRR